MIVWNMSQDEDGEVTLDKLNEFVFVDEDEVEDPEYLEESSGESDDSLEYESENESPRRKYGLRTPVSLSYELADDIKPVTVKFEWDQLIVPHEEGDITLEKLKALIFEEEDDDEDPAYEYAASSADSEASVDYEFESESEMESGQDVSDLESDDEDGVESSVGTTSNDILTSVVTKSCFDLVDKQDVSWSTANKTEEYIASFDVSQFGIRLVDTGLSIVEKPISFVSTWLAGSVRSTRRHLRAARRAGEKLNGDSCKSRSLLVHMTNLFPLNAVLGSFGVVLVDEDFCMTHDEDIDDPEYTTSSDSEDSLEYRSDIESEALDTDVDSEIIENTDVEEFEVITSTDMEEVDTE